MDEWTLARRVHDATPECPDIWNRIKFNVAKYIADELIASLEIVTNPCGRESHDRKQEFAEFMDIQTRKGA